MVPYPPSTCASGACIHARAVQDTSAPMPSNSSERLHPPPQRHAAGPAEATRPATVRAGSAPATGATVAHVHDSIRIMARVAATPTSPEQRRERAANGNKFCLLAKLQVRCQSQCSSHTCTGSARRSCSFAGPHLERRSTREIHRSLCARCCAASIRFAQNGAPQSRRHTEQWQMLDDRSRRVDQ